MESYLEALDLWEAMEEDEMSSLSNNPTMTQIKNQKERKTKKTKVKSCLFVVVSLTISTIIMTIKSPKSIWDYLKEEYAGDERIRDMQVLNLMREFEPYEASITSLENTKDLSKITLAEVIRLIGPRAVETYEATLYDRRCSTNQEPRNWYEHKKKLQEDPTNK
ncbi:hypothetical protein CR513_29082, partial [Mucuna pruriens]